eukprot:scaffold4600_cov245-Pinguiococcus_pyrenoidosus.AAC.3
MPQHVENLLVATHQTPAQFQVYPGVLKKLWNRMLEPDWRTALKVGPPQLEVERKAPLIKRDALLPTINHRRRTCCTSSRRRGLPSTAWSSRRRSPRCPRSTAPVTRTPISTSSRRSRAAPARSKAATARRRKASWRRISSSSSTGPRRSSPILRKSRRCASTRARRSRRC